MKATIAIALLLICSTADASGLRKLEKPAGVDIPSQASDNQNTLNLGVNGLFGDNAAAGIDGPGDGIDGQGKGDDNGIGLGVQEVCVASGACSVGDTCCGSMYSRTMYTSCIVLIS